GVGRVDALPARARGAVDVDAEVLVGQLHLDVLGLGEHGHGHGRGVDAPLGLGHRHALHAVHAALELEAAEGALPDDERDHLLEAAEAGRARDQALELLVAPLDLGEAVEHALTQRRGASASPTPRLRRAGDPRPRQAGVEPEPLRLRPYLRWKRSTRPAVSTSFCLPVKNGWHAEQISTWMVGTVE